MSLPLGSRGLLPRRMLKKRADFARGAEDAAGAGAGDLHEFAGVVVIGSALRAPPFGAAGAAGFGEFAAVPGGDLFAIVLIGGEQDAPVGFTVAVQEEV